MRTVCVLDGSNSTRMHLLHVVNLLLKELVEFHDLVFDHEPKIVSLEKLTILFFKLLPNC